MASLDEFNPNRWQAEDEDFLEREDEYVMQNSVVFTTKPLLLLAELIITAAPPRQQQQHAAAAAGLHHHHTSSKQRKSKRNREIPRVEEPRKASPEPVSNKKPGVVGPATTTLSKQQQQHDSKAPMQKQPSNGEAPVVSTKSTSSSTTVKKQEKQQPPQRRKRVPEPPLSSSSSSVVEDEEDDDVVSLTLVDIFGKGMENTRPFIPVKQEKWNDSVMVMHQSTIGGGGPPAHYLKEMQLDDNDDDDKSLAIEDIFPILGDGKAAGVSNTTTISTTTTKPSLTSKKVVPLLVPVRPSQPKPAAPPTPLPRAAAPPTPQPKPAPRVIRPQKPPPAALEASAAVIRTRTNEIHNASMSLTPEQIQEQESRPWRKTSQLSSGKLKGSSKRINQDGSSGSLHKSASSSKESAESPDAKRKVYQLPTQVDGNRQVPAIVEPITGPDGNMVNLVDSGLTADEKRRSSLVKENVGDTPERKLESKKSKRSKKAKKKKSRKNIDDGSGDNIKEHMDASSYLESQYSFRKQMEAKPDANVESESNLETEPNAEESEEAKRERRRRKRERKEKKKKKKRDKSKSERHLSNRDSSPSRRTQSMNNVVVRKARTESPDDDEQKKDLDTYLHGMSKTPRKSSRSIKSDGHRSSKLSSARHSDADKKAPPLPGVHEEMQMSMRDRLDFLKEVAAGEHPKEEEPISAPASAAMRSRRRMSHTPSVRTTDLSRAPSVRTTDLSRAPSARTTDLSRAPSVRTSHVTNRNDASLIESQMMSVGQLDFDTAVPAKKKITKKPVVAKANATVGAEETNSSLGGGKKKKKRGFFGRLFGSKKCSGTVSADERKARKRFRLFRRRSEPPKTQQPVESLNASSSDWYEANEGAQSSGRTGERLAKSHREQSTRKKTSKHKRSASSGNVISG